MKIYLHYNDRPLDDVGECLFYFNDDKPTQPIILHGDKFSLIFANSQKEAIQLLKEGNDERF